MPETAHESRPHPLQGVKVVDLGQIYNGPYATFLMAMAGADVIKVEPREGESLRVRGAVGTGKLPFAMLNSNKRCITLNLKSQRGRGLLIDLVRRADVLLENFAPDTMERLGLPAELLLAENPRLIYASGSGYGRSGPKRDYLAMDLTVQAVAGIMSVTGYPEGPPLKAGVALCDFLGGVHLYGAIVTALYEREKTGCGRVVEVAMLEAAYVTLASNLGLFHGSGGKAPPRTGNRHGGLSMAPYNVYPAADGHVAIIVVGEEHWRQLLRAMGRADLLDDPRFADNKARVAHIAQVDALIENWTRGLPRERIFELTKQFRVPSAPVRDLVEVVNDEHMHGRGMLKRIEHPELGPIVVPTTAMRFHGTPQMEIVPSGRLGQYTAEVLQAELGLDDAEIAALRRDQVI
ncbi:MAG: CoA transferase [Alphaproteobacteria bacterium]|nr:CoA transferase [Alphaproteobacteria bacterium]